MVPTVSQIRSSPTQRPTQRRPIARAERRIRLRLPLPLFYFVPYSFAPVLRRPTLVLPAPGVDVLHCIFFVALVFRCSTSPLSSSLAPLIFVRNLANTRRPPLLTACLAIIVMLRNQRLASVNRSRCLLLHCIYHFANQDEYQYGLERVRI